VKKPVVIILAILLVLACMAFWVAHTEPARVSLQFVGYRWTASDATWRADFRLTNGTRRAVKYASDAGPLLHNKAPTMFFREPSERAWHGLQWSTLIYNLREYDLEPGESVPCSIPIEPGAPPKQAGILRDDPRVLPRSQPIQQLQICWLSIKSKLKIKTTPPEQIWGRETLSLPKSAQSGPAK
jgi:hypothetical protein